MTIDSPQPHREDPRPVALGAGASAVVRAVVDRVTTRRGRRLVEKIARRRSAHDGLERELAILSSLRHPCLARLHGARRESDGELVLIERRIDGSPLLDHLRDCPADLMDVTRDVASALDALHRVGLVHGDVKPENVVVESRGERARGVLIDLGATTLAGMPLTGGTPGFLAPEALAGGLAAPAMDMFALGALLAELAPVDGTELLLLARRLRSSRPGDRPTARQLLSEIPRPRRATRSEARELAMALPLVLPAALESRIELVSSIAHEKLAPIFVVADRDGSACASSPSTLTLRGLPGSGRHRLALAIHSMLLRKSARGVPPIGVIDSRDPAGTSLGCDDQRNIDLRPFKPREIAGLLERIDDSGVFLEEWAAELHAHTGGLPGDVLASLVALHAGGDIDLESQPWDRPLPDSLPLAPALGRRLSRRLGAAPVPAGARRALDALALSTLPLSGAEIALVARATRSDVAHALRLLRRAAISLLRAPREVGRGWCVPRSAARVLERRAPRSPARRRALHSRMAAFCRSIRRSSATALSSLTHHLAHAGRPRLAARGLESALAELRGATHERRLAWIKGLPQGGPAQESSDSWRRCVLTALVTEATRAGRRDLVARALAARIETDLEEPADRARLARQLPALPRSMTCDLEHLGDEGEPLTAAMLAWSRGRVEEAGSLAAHIDRTSLADPRERSLHALLSGQIAAARQHPRLAVQELEDSAELAQAAGLQAEAAVGLSALATLLLERGAPERAETIAREALSNALAADQPRALALAHGALSRIARELGEPARALTCVRHALAQAARARDEALIESLAIGAGILAKRAGSRSSAERWMRMARDSSLATGNLRAAAPAQLNLAVLARDRGDLEAAEVECASVLELAGAHRGYRARALAILADIERRRGALDRCRELSSEARILFAELDHTEGLSSLDRLSAECALAEGDVDGAWRAWRRAWSSAERSGSLAVEEEARLLETRLATHSGDDKRVRHRLAEAGSRFLPLLSGERRLAWKLAEIEWRLGEPTTRLDELSALIEAARDLVAPTTPLALCEELEHHDTRLRARRRGSGEEQLHESVCTTVPQLVSPLVTSIGARELFEHEAMRSRREEGAFSVALIESDAPDAISRRLRGLATVVEIDPRRWFAVLPGASITLLADVLEGVVATRSVAGWARFPADGEDIDSLLAAAAARMGDPPPSTWSGRTIAEREGLEDLPRADTQGAVLGLLSRLLAAPRSLDRTLELALDLLAGAVSAPRGYLILELPARPGERPVRILAARGGQALAGDREDGDAAASRSVIEQVLASGSPVMVADAIADPELGRRHSIQRLSIRSLLCVPIADDAGCFGALYLDDDSRAQAFGNEELRLALAFARRAAGLLRRARENESTARELASARREFGKRSDVPEIIGNSPAIRELLAQLDRVLQTDVPVLVTGPSGAGKELIAAALHRHGRRADRELIAINASAMSDGLLESELFGHARGAYTGAVSDHPGVFEASSGGTLFLDEVGDMSQAMQSRLLRVLETGRVRRVGETCEREVDVRIVAATHRDLEKMAASGDFREDLFYRLRVVHLHVPPLCERMGDLPLLVAHLVERACEEMEREIPDVAPATLTALAAHDWPGNIRELANELRRALVFAGERIDVEHLSERVRGDRRRDSAPETTRATGQSRSLADRYGGLLKPAREAFELEYLEEALDRHGGVIARAAATLGCDRGQLSRRLRSLRHRRDEREEQDPGSLD